MQNLESKKTNANALGSQISLHHAFGILAGNAAVARSLVGPVAGVHAHWGFVHIMIIDHLATEHRRPSLALTKEWSRVTPKVAAVGDNTAGEGVAGASRLGSVAKAVLGGGPKSVDSEERRPLLDAAVFPSVWGRAAEGRVGSLSGSRKTSSFHGRGSGGHGRCKGLGAWVGPVNVVASHVLVGCLVARDLDELDGAQHCDPDQLEGDPHIKNQREGVARGVVTQSVINNIAGSIGRSGERIDICIMLVDRSWVMFSLTTKNPQAIVSCTNRMMPTSRETI